MGKALLAVMGLDGRGIILLPLFTSHFHSFSIPDMQLGNCEAQILGSAAEFGQLNIFGWMDG